MAKEQEWIVIRGLGSVSGLGCTKQEVAQSYALGRSAFTALPSLGPDTAVSTLSPSAEKALQRLLQDEPSYSTLDRSVQLAILAARQAVTEAGWAPEDLETTGVNIGSSRGATGLMEQYHADFLAHPDQRLPPSTSPSTTLGNVASWVAHDLQAHGPHISHSVTCSTALQAFANGTAWLRAGMAKRFLVGGTEAPLTPFTLAQMKAIGIYSKLAAEDQPCRPLHSDSQNTFVLGEGAAVFALERMNRNQLLKLPQDKVLILESVGLGFERSPSKTGITPSGEHFRKAMENAFSIAAVSPEQVDAVILHAPGTKAGDAAELSALSHVFGEHKPLLYTNKNLIGHTLGASGALSAEMAIFLLQKIEAMPAQANPTARQNSFFPTRVLVNTAGFGGNSASLLISTYSL